MQLTLYREHLRLADLVPPSRMAAGRVMGHVPYPDK